MKNILHKMIIVQQLNKDGLRKCFPIKKTHEYTCSTKYKSCSLQQSILHYAIFYNARTNEIIRTIHCHSQRTQRITASIINMQPVSSI
jgi:hypothetical protein